MCLARRLSGTMIPHPLSVGALVLAVIESRLFGASVPCSRSARRPAPALASAGSPAVGLAAIAAAADGELGGARSAPAHPQIQPSSARRNLDAALDPLHPGHRSPSSVQLTTSGIRAPTRVPSFSRSPTPPSGCLADLATFRPARDCCGIFRRRSLREFSGAAKNAEQLLLASATESVARRRRARLAKAGASPQRSVAATTRVSPPWHGPSRRPAFSRPVQSALPPAVRELVLPRRTLLLPSPGPMPACHWQWCARTYRTTRKPPAPSAAPRRLPSPC